MNIKTTNYKYTYMCQYQCVIYKYCSQEGEKIYIYTYIHIYIASHCEVMPPINTNKIIKISSMFVVFMPIVSMW